MPFFRDILFAGKFKVCFETFCFEYWQTEAYLLLEPKMHGVSQVFRSSIFEHGYKVWKPYPGMLILSFFKIYLIYQRFYCPF